MSAIEGRLRSDGAAPCLTCLISTSRADALRQLDDVCLRVFLWLREIHAKLRKMTLLQTVTRLVAWKLAAESVSAAWGHAFISRCSTHPCADVYIILRDFAKYLPPEVASQYGLVPVSASFSQESLAALHEAMYRPSLAKKVYAARPCGRYGI